VLIVQIVVLGYGSMLPCRWVLVLFWSVGIYLHDRIVLQPEWRRILQRQQLKLFLHYQFVSSITVGCHILPLHSSCRFLYTQFIFFLHFITAKYLMVNEIMPVRNEWMSLEHLVEWHWQGNTKVVREKLFHYHFVHHTSHMDWPEIEPRPPEWEAGD